MTKAKTHYIIIPEGLAVAKNGKVLPFPSFVFRQVIDFTINLVTEKDSLYIAPANHFGSEISEQEAAFNYFKKKGTKCNIIWFKIPSSKYIDTFDNAYYLKSFLKEKFDCMHFELVCAKLHSYRTEYCFKKLGFKITKVHRVNYSISDELIVKRLFYYKYKTLHTIYEAIALCRDVVYNNKHLRTRDG